MGREAGRALMSVRGWRGIIGGRAPVVVRGSRDGGRAGMVVVNGVGIYK